MFFCESNEPEPVCPICGCRLKHYDYRSRNMKLEGGSVKIIKIRRLYCPSCDILHNEFPDCLSPYKQYATEVIEGALEGIVTPFDEESEDYPSTDSIKRWKSWLYDIRRLLLVTIRTRWSLIPDYKFGNDCIHVSECTLQHVCGDNRCNYLCRSCKKMNYPGFCHSRCKKYLAIECLELTKPPYVCNNFKAKDRCIKNKYFYSAVEADKRSKYNLSRTRNATRLTEADIKRLYKLISPLINKGQPLIHIMAQHKDEIPVSIRTIYNYIEKGFFSIKNIDLRRKVSYKQRRKSRKKDLSGYAVQAYLIGRKYSDFKEYLLEFDDDSDVVEMDTVLGTKSSRKRLLTMTFRRNNLMLLFLLSDGKASSVVNIFRYLEHELGLACFRRVFKIFLTDNGGEFKDNVNLEYTKDNEIRTKVYYCDPMASW